MKFILISFLFVLVCFSGQAQVKYVTVAGAGSMDGSSWSNAFNSLQFADTAYTFTAGTQVWLAAGTYYPDRYANGGLLPPPAPSTDGGATFVLNRGVQFYGGFNGTETTLQQRVDARIHAQNETILSGDFGSAGLTFDNAYVIVTLPQAGAGERLDGLSIAYAYNTGINISFSAPVLTPAVINNCVIRDHSPRAFTASGIYVTGNGITAATLNITNSFILNNHNSVGADAGILASSCKLNCVNSAFYANGSQNFGGNSSSCIHFNNSNGQLSNCVFYNNDIYPGNQNGFAIELTNASDSVYINNSILWNNQNASEVSNLLIDAGANLVSIKHSIFQTQPVAGNTAAVSINTFSADPLFINAADPDGADNAFGTADDGLQLQNISPAIDQGKNELVSPLVNKDVLGNMRVTGCRVDIGAYENVSATYNTLGLYNGIGQTCSSFPVSSGNTAYIDSASCHTMSVVLPNGANPLTGPVQVCVSNSATVPLINSIPYVPRHYDIIPANNAATATARLTIYFTQQDFNAYNAAVPAFPQLPTNPSDFAGIANILVEQDHGISVTGVPGTYNGSTVYINPADNDIRWNAANAVWEVSFDVTGFSGFFITTFSSLPVDLVSFSGKQNKDFVDLFWTTTSEINADYFDIQRSSDGKNFISLGNQPASGNLNGSSYSFNDKSPFAGKNYYRLISVDANRSKKYSSIILINTTQNEKTDFTLTPNPAHLQCTISISGKLQGKSSVILYDLKGSKVAEVYAGELNSNAFSTSFSVMNLKKGIYIISVHIGNEYTRKQLLVD